MAALNEAIQQVIASPEGGTVTLHAADCAERHREPCDCATPRVLVVPPTRVDELPGWIAEVDARYRLGY